MENLFSQFHATRAQARQLLEEGLLQLRDGFSPDVELCEKISSSLSSLRAVYEMLCDRLPETVAPEEIPAGKRSVDELREIWENSLTNRLNAVRTVLEAFARVCSDEQRYVNVLSPYVEEADALLRAVDTGAVDARTADVSAFQLFLDGLNADPRVDEALGDRLLDGPFSPRIVKGLFDRKYYLSAGSADGGEAVAERIADAPSEPVFRDTADAAEEAGKTEEAGASPSEPAPSNPMPARETASPAAENETKEPEPQPALSAGETPVAENGEAAESAESAEEAFIHPINPIKPGKLPSEQKLTELIKRTVPVFYILLDNLTSAGLMDEKYVFDYVEENAVELRETKEHCVESIDVLEKKGLICVYAYEGRRILCYTRLMESILGKNSLATRLKLLFGHPKKQTPSLIGTQDMPLALFTHRLAKSDHVIRTINRYTADSATLSRALGDYVWSEEKDCHVFEYKEGAGEKLRLSLVACEDRKTAVPEGEGILFDADALPEMENAGPGRRCRSSILRCQRRHGRQVRSRHQRDCQ